MTQHSSRAGHPVFRAARFGPVLAAALFLVPTGARAQGVTYREVSRTELSGTAGKVLKVLSGGMKSEQTVSIGDGKMRTDSEGSSTILDTQAKRWIFLDHEKKQYYAMSLDDMMESMSQMGAQMKEAAAQQPAQAQRGTAADSSGIEWSFDLAVDRTGRKEQVSGYPAEEVLLTLKIQGKGTDQETGDTASMNMVLLNDLWMSTDAALTSAMKEFGAGMSEAARESGASMTAGMEEAFGQDPRIKAGMEKAAKEAAKLEGIQLKGTTYVVLLPPGTEFDRQLALEGPRKKEGSGASDAAKKAVSNKLGGLLGRKPKEEPTEETPAAPQQATLMTTTTEVTSIDVGPVPADRFAVPAGYTEVHPPTATGG